jgi:hypothetical protein
MTKKKFILILLVLNIVFSAGMTFAYWASEILGVSQDGTGTLDIGDWGTPIFTTSEFYNFVNRTTSVSTEKYYLANDLDFSSYTWVPVLATRIFRGTLDGNGKTISNLTINYNSSSIAYSGIFPRIDGATVTDLTLDNVQIISYLSSSTRRSGLISGDAYNGKTNNLSYLTIIDSGVQGRSTNGVGGLVGYVSGTNTRVIMNNIKATNLKAWNYSTSTGGLIGTVTASSYIEMYDIDFQGEAYSYSSTSYVGGLIGYALSNSYITIERAVVEASFRNTLVTAAPYTNLYSARYLGGIFGRHATASARSLITDVYYTGNLFPSTDTRRLDVGTISGLDSTQATLTRVSYARVGFRATGGVLSYTVTGWTGQMSTVVSPNNSTVPSATYWNSLYSQMDPLIWTQSSSGTRPYLIR